MRRGIAAQIARASAGVTSLNFGFGFGVFSSSIKVPKFYRINTVGVSELCSGFRPGKAVRRLRALRLSRWWASGQFSNLTSQPLGFVVQFGDLRFEQRLLLLRHGVQHLGFSSSFPSW